MQSILKCIHTPFISFYPPPLKIYPRLNGSRFWLFGFFSFLLAGQAIAEGLFKVLAIQIFSNKDHLALAFFIFIPVPIWQALKDLMDTLVHEPLLTSLNGKNPFHPEDIL
mmetsp:Transcript_19165/g.34681  ORF Transcript_19165/g.34681 Transcript_19165/m.34681 type:complete len:110 (-) Transcript_19165:1265-1594(-)